MSDREHPTPPADLPEPPELDAERPAYLPDVFHGCEAAGVVLRATYRVSVREGEAHQLEQLAERIGEARDAVPYDYLRNMLAASTDLLNIAAFLDYWAPDPACCLERHLIPVAALALEIVPQVERLAERLIDAANAAAGFEVEVTS